MTIHILDVERNAEGDVLACMGKEGDGCSYRIAGPKAWGGSRNIATLKISESDLVAYIKDYAPEVHEKLKAL